VSARFSPFDTTLDARAAQTAIYRQVGGRERLAMAFRLTAAARSMTMAGVRTRHPDYSDEQVRFAFARIVLGDDVMRLVWPDRELVER
jgi:hypothetical protein